MNKRPISAGGVLRVAALVGTTTLIASALVLLRARVRADEVLLEAGAQMMVYARATRPAAEQTVELNGQRVHLRVVTTDQSPDTVLDHFADRCRQRDASSRIVGRAGLLDGVLRTPEGPEGAVACLDVGGQELDAAGLAGRLRAFASTGDLGRVGALRFAHAKQVAEGHTLIITSWVDGPLSLSGMFPVEGDAPGMELPGIPRPRGSRRTLSAHSDGDRALLNSYRTPHGDASEHTLTYRAQLIAAGFVVPDVPDESRESALGFTAVRGGLGLVVSVRRGPDDALETTTMSLP